MMNAMHDEVYRSHDSKIKQPFLTVEEKSMKNIFGKGKYKNSQQKYHTECEYVVLDPIVLDVPDVVVQ